METNDQGWLLNLPSSRSILNASVMNGSWPNYVPWRLTRIRLSSLAASTSHLHLYYVAGRCGDLAVLHFEVD